MTHVVSFKCLALFAARAFIARECPSATSAMTRQDRREAQVDLLMDQALALAELQFDKLEATEQKQNRKRVDQQARQDEMRAEQWRTMQQKKENMAMQKKIDELGQCY